MASRPESSLGGTDAEISGIVRGVIYSRKLVGDMPTTSAQGHIGLRAKGETELPRTDSDLTVSSSEQRRAADVEDPDPSCNVSVVDLFCGTGGFSYGLEQADSRFRTIAAIDNDHWATRTASANLRGARVIHADIRSVSAEELLSPGTRGSVDVIVGGPPCQGFTSLRPSRGTALDDPRNILYRDYQRLVNEISPKVFILENVVGLVNATRGALLEDLIEGFEMSGYTVDWRIINSANFGVPQKRERFFLLGVRNDVLSGRILSFPQPTHAFDGRTIGIRNKSRHVTFNGAERKAITVWDAIGDLSPISSGEESSEYRSSPRNPYQAHMRGKCSKVTLHQAARHNSKMLEVMRFAGSSRSELPEGLVSSGYSSCYSRMAADEPSPTITVKFTSPASSKCIHPFDDRAITPREAARLQSFPDTYRFLGSKTSVASQIGNAVPPLLAGSFAPLLRELIQA